MIHWDQIIGWERVAGRGSSVVRNPDYREWLYAGSSFSGPQPQLAGFPQSHPAWGIEPWSAFATCSERSSIYSVLF
ncbi:MAG: hypothetical protein JHC61_16595 [Burkholderiaceae bacterium]|nr:hypothetical protein [Burkholderiaceae bacterium]